MDSAASTVLRMHKRMDTVRQLRALVEQHPAATLEVIRCWMQQRARNQIVLVR